MPHVYLLECADGSFYVGSTWHLERRLMQHQTGQGARHTAARRPVRLVHCEAYERIDEAYRRERQVHGWSRAKKQALIAGRCHDLPALSRTSRPAR